MLGWNIAGKGFTRFRAQAAVDERSRQSDIGPAIRFFVFGTKPNPEQLIRMQGNPPLPPVETSDRPAELTERLYTHLAFPESNRDGTARPQLQSSAALKHPPQRG